MFMGMPMYGAVKKEGGLHREASTDDGLEESNSGEGTSRTAQTGMLIIAHRITKFSRMF